MRIDLVHTSTILHVRLVPKIQPAPCYIPKIQISCSQNWRLHNPRLAIPKLQRARKLPPAPKSRHAKPPSNHEPKGPLVQIGGGTFVTHPTFWTSASLSHGSPLPSPPFRHSKSQAAITSLLQPRNPTLLRPPPHRCPAGASSSMTSSTTTA